jgi:hypothetical protein
MPEARIPTTPAGWLVALAASFIGFISGFIAIRILGPKLA